MTTTKIKDENGTNIEESIFDDEFFQIVCPECNVSCIAYTYDDGDEIPPFCSIPIHAECPKCGWGVT